MNIAVLCSGNGTNLQAIIDAVNNGDINADIKVVISDNNLAYALERASKAGIEAIFINKKDYKNREDFDKEIAKYLNKYNIELVVLAGFMRMISPCLVKKYKNKIINIHPALLPSFKGTNSIKDALNYGVKVTGVTVHFVDEGMDTGPVIIQEAITIENNDDLESVTEKIHRIEHKIYPQVIKWITENRLKINGRKVDLID